MSFEPKPTERKKVSDAEAQAATSADLARENLGRARAGLGDLETALAPLAKVSETFVEVSEQLSNMVMAGATEITRSGATGRAFLPLVEQLADAARTSLTAAHELRRAASSGRACMRTLTALADESQTALERLGSAIATLSSAAAQAARTQGPTVEVVVPATAAASDKAARVAELTDEVLRLKNQRSPGPKN